MEQEHLQDASKNDARKGDGGTDGMSLHGGGLRPPEENVGDPADEDHQAGDGRDERIADAHDASH